VKHFKAIAAMSENRVIGRGNSIPWHLPEDFKWFKEVTTGHIIVMGRKTFESIGKPLPNRETIVLSRSGFAHPGVKVIRELGQLDVSGEARDVFICGGAQVYEQTLPLCSDLYLTRVKRVVEGDAFFPLFEHLFTRAEVLRDTPEFTIEHWRNARL
jgi:dihydrofolate reductase